MMAKELRVERERSKLNLEQLTNLLDGGKAVTDTRRRMTDIVLKDPVFNNDDEYFLSAEETFEKSMEKSIRYMQIKKEHDMTKMEQSYLSMAIGMMETGVHEIMFIPTIAGQGTDDQKAMWLPLAYNMDIIGAYAQTEMGHGTFLRGLETTSTYDPLSQQFFLNSPTMTSLKWWPGGLGHTATHAIVMARLITKGEDYGIHPFIVQLRSLNDHTPLPGVELGDIGPKFGSDGGSNGFLKLSSVRIPREQMLMRYSQVSTDGTYSKPPNDKISHGTMVLVRAAIVLYVAQGLSKCVTIATRYSTVRRQTQNRPGEPESQVIDYQTQQYKLLPLIATAYAMRFAGQYITMKHDKVASDIAKGNFGSLGEHHATSAGLKAFSADICCQGIELCRLSCGGHGYSRASGIPDVYTATTVAQTAEGENTVLYLQTARFIHKLFDQKLLMSQLPVDISYLATDFIKHDHCSATTSLQFNDPHILLDAYRQRARRLTEIASRRYQEGIRMRLDHPAAWNYSLVDWVVAAKAHCNYVVLNVFQTVTRDASIQQCDNNIMILQNLFSLYGTFDIIQNSGEFEVDGYMSSDQITKVRHHLYNLLDIVRHEAVSLVDAFDYPDAILNSCLGRYDGDVYTHLYKWAQKAPRNKTKVHPTYMKHLKAVLNSKSKL